MRRILWTVLLLLLIPAWILAQGWPSGTLPIVGKDGQFLGVDHVGALFVTQPPMTFGASSWLVQVQHVQAVTHIASAGLALANQALAVRCVDTGGTTFQACGGGSDPASVVQSSAWTIQAAHQGGEWNVRHVTSVTHVAGRLILSNVAGVAVTVTGTALDVNCTGCSAASVVAVDHISSVTHVVLVASGHANVTRQHISGAFRAWRIANCGTTAAIAVKENRDRRDLYLQNLGGPAASGSAHYNIYLGYGTQGHVALTINNGWVLHAMGYLGAGTTPSTGPTTQLILYNYQGPLACISATATGGGPQLSILEVLR